MPAGNIIFERDKRVRRIRQIVQQNLDPGIWKGFADEAYDALVVFEKFVSVVGDCLAIVLLE